MEQPIQKNRVEVTGNPPAATPPAVPVETPPAPQPETAPAVSPPPLAAPVITNPPAGPGRPEISEEQYQKWFDLMAPFFQLGETLNEAIEDAGLENHRTLLYNKSRLNDWFAYKMKTLQAYPGKLANKILVKRLIMVNTKLAQELPVSKDEMDDVKFVAEKHRSSAPHFVNRTETATAKPIEEIVADLEKGEDNKDDVAETYKQQGVAPTPPVQNQE